MNKLALTAVITLFILSCSKETIVGSGNLASQEREVGTFSRISSEGIIDLEIRQGDTQFVEITADDNIIDQVRTRVVNGELQLYLDGDSYRSIQIKAVVTAARITGIRNSGTGDVTVLGLGGEASFTLFNSGTGNVTLEGSADSLELKNDGSGDVSAFDFSVLESDISLIGSGNCELTCMDTMTVFIDGSGNVYYRGNPSLQVTIEGSGKVINSN